MAFVELEAYANHQAENRVDGIMAEFLDELPPLTKKQEGVMRYLATFWSKNRHMPTQKQIGEAMGVQAAAAQGYVEALAKKGYVMRIAGRRRNLRFTSAGVEKLTLIGAPLEQRDLFEGND